MSKERQQDTILGKETTGQWEICQTHRSGQKDPEEFNRSTTSETAHLENIIFIISQMLLGF